MFGSLDCRIICAEGHERWCGHIAITCCCAGHYNATCFHRLRRRAFQVVYLSSNLLVVMWLPRVYDVFTLKMFFESSVAACNWKDCLHGKQTIARSGVYGDKLLVLRRLEVVAMASMVEQVFDQLFLLCLSNVRLLLRVPSLYNNLVLFTHAHP